MKARLKKHLKQFVHGRFVVEIAIWSIDDQRYQNGVKYSLVFVEPSTGRKVLMDNHHPKSPHYHLDEKEFDYQFEGEDKLFLDFEKLIFQHFGVKL